jgi:hypothetical protein
MVPYLSTRLLAASERVGGPRTKRRGRPGRQGLPWTWRRVVRVRAYHSWDPHASTMCTFSHSTRFLVSCTCIRSCGSLRSTFRGLRAFLRTRRCHGLRSSGSSTRAKVWRRRLCRVELGPSCCLSPKSGSRQMSHQPWLGSSDRGKALLSRL